MVQDRKMVLKPLSIVMVSDGMLDLPGKTGGAITGASIWRPWKSFPAT